MPQLTEPPSVAAEAEAYRLFQEVTEFLKPWYNVFRPLQATGWLGS